MKNIFHLGCSWSECNNMVGHSLPYFITNGLEDKIGEFKYHASGIGGCGLGTQFEILLKILESGTTVDLVLFEVTTSDRYHCQINNTPIRWDQSDSHKNILICREWAIENYVFWMPIYKEIINSFWTYLHNKHTYLKIAKVINSADFNWESIFLARIMAIKGLLAKANIPCIIYAHDSNQILYQDTRSLAFNHVYSELDFCINNLISKKEFDKFSIDQGRHMSVAGDKYIAENIMIPRILEKLQ